MSKFSNSVDGFIAAYAPGWDLARQKKRLQANRFRTVNARLSSAGGSHSLKSSQRFIQRSGPIERGFDLEEFDDDVLCGMRDQSCELFNNSAMYPGVLRQAVNVITNGLELHPRTGDKGLDADLRDAFRHAGRRGGELYEDGTSFRRAIRLQCLHRLREGDILKYQSEEGIQMIEACRVQSPDRGRRNMRSAGGDSGRRIINGVELMPGRNRAGRYWVLFGHDFKNMRHGGIRASECFLYGPPEYATMYRGWPPLQQSLRAFQDIAGFLEAELITQRAAACIMGIIKGPDPSEAANGLNVGGGSSGGSRCGMPELTEFAPGIIAKLFDDEEFKLVESSRPSTSFEPFVKAMKRVSTIPIGLPIELAYMDFSDSSFSTAQMVVQAAHQAATDHRLEASESMAWDYTNWLDRQDAVRISARVRRAAKNVRGYDIRDPRPMVVRPEKEALARALDLASGSTSLTRIQEDMGGTIETIIDEHATELAYAKTVVAAKKLAARGNEDAVAREILLGIQERLSTKMQQHAHTDDGE